MPDPVAADTRTRSSRVSPAAGRGARRTAPDIAAIRLAGVRLRPGESPSGVSLRPSAVASVRAALVALGVPFVLLDTCNRSELYWLGLRGGPGDDQVAALFEDALRRSGVTAAIAQVSGESAVRHLFRVASGLDSLVLGEMEILGQVRQALQRAPENALLGRVFRAAVRTGRMARAETAIGVGAISVASSAIHTLAAKTPLTRSRVLVVGAGQTARAAARQIAAGGAASIVIANRTAAHAESLAAGVGGRAVRMEGLEQELALADVLIVASRGEAFLVDAAMLARARPDGRPLVCVDLSMPRLVDPAVAALPGTSVIDLAAVQDTVEENRRRRTAEVPKVEAIAERELEWLVASEQRASLRPPVASVRRRPAAGRRVESRHGPGERRRRATGDPA